MKRILAYFLGVFFCLSLIGCGGAKEEKLEWALHEKSYKFAVGVDSYNGDKVSPGKYEFDITNKKAGKAAIYDVYVTDLNTESVADLKSQGIKPVSVGGVNAAPVVIDLKKGEYVYCVPYAKLVYKPEGVLVIKKTKK